MKITCPSCSTSYDVRADALGPSGRSVKCTRCGNRWHAVAEEPAETFAKGNASKDDARTAKFDPTEEENGLPGPEDWGEEVADGMDDDDVASDTKSARDIVNATEMALRPADPPEGPEEPDGSAQAQPDKPKDIESLARRPRIRIRRRKRDKNQPSLLAGLKTKAKRFKVQRVVGAMVFLLAIALGAFAYSLRTEIVARVPDLAGLYQLAGLEVNLRGLEFKDLRTFREVEAGTVVLVIEGTIENPGKKASYVPAVRLALRSEDAQEIYAWIVEPKVRQLEAGETTRFRTRLTTPPDLAADIHVRFTDRRNQQAKL
ncbi:zinc-ribbon domain-containing protein [Stappia sp. F7233]|uniref:Zinc-ribbon domain-containing protein n=1 Tax=Stappia albiluteola TaxID=2758565 RepID=A0A839AFG5_9HYPH|nr:zinc-ribbon domain-containing protein [Stappia albiluteola]MBA5778590.1 zinc-ribbon domain-containing protein [Stappia albiluteola]